VTAFRPVFGRRRLLRGCSGALAAAALGADGLAAPGLGALDAQVLSIPVAGRGPRRALVLTPRQAPRKEGWPVLVLLHGLAETTSEALGLHAWSDRYGLIDADARLRSGSVAPKEPNRYLTPERTAAIDMELRRRPYRGLILVCPVTPNVYKGGATALSLDHYADWIDSALLPAVRSATPARRDAAATAIDGCSLGGYMALETFLRKPESFGALGGVQAAYGERMAMIYAERLRAAFARTGPRPLHIESSLWDPSLKAHQALNTRLHELGVDSDLAVLPGGHDQTFLREIGALEMLLWHDRRIA
jgi:pimeloyl-ACP methyl ester carboxylesterase